MRVQSHVDRVADQYGNIRDLAVDTGPRGNHHGTGKVFQRFAGRPAELPRDLVRERRAIYDGWHTDGDDWHAERLFAFSAARALPTPATSVMPVSAS